MRNRSTNRLLAVTMALVLLFSTILSGCQFGGTRTTPAVRVGERDAAAVARELNEKYADKQNVKYAEGQIGLPRDHKFLIEFDFDPIALGMTTYPEIAGLYLDPELTKSAYSTYEWASEDKRSYTIAPSESPMLAAYGGDETYPFGYEKGKYRLFSRDPYTDWGNVGTMYLATKVDLHTGEALEKPIVQVITFKGELNAPVISMSMTEDGVVQFTWQAVKGAKAYYIVTFDYFDYLKHPSVGYVGYTANTCWNSVRKTDGITDEIYRTNDDFKTYHVSEDNWLDPVLVETLEEKYGPNGGAIQYEELLGRSFAVIAVNEQGTSMYSNQIDIADIASVAPNCLAYNMNKLSDEGFTKRIEGISSMPSYYWITLCNGVLSQRIVNYDIDAYTEKAETWYIVDDEDGTVEPFTINVLRVPYTVDGTAFNGEVVITQYDQRNVYGQLGVIKARQDALRSKTGDVKREVLPEDEGSEPTTEKPGQNKVVVDDTHVTANSALSEYLAYNMLSGNIYIDLTEFPEALDQEYLVDAWSEAFYQNPLILGVSGARISRDGKTLNVLYDDDQATRESKQEQIRVEVNRVVGQIINDSMTNREKEYAINQYLCDNVEYDYAALENAAANNYQSVDSRYYDSFTAYGALINGVGVCASYAASYKLLADAAGLDCVVVTGHLNGSVGHAWNRVNLGNGLWVTVDSTNNDNDLIPNALLNVPDYAIDSILVQDSGWLLDSAISQYSNQEDTDEYYHVNNLFFDKSDVADVIVAQLSGSNVAVVRTDYRLTDDQFYEIGKEVHNRLGQNIYGCYWTGVIVITTDSSLIQ